MSVFGIRLRLHPLFTFIMFASVMTGRFLELAVLFGVVFIHELGHTIAALQCGWRVREIRLLPFGGVAVVDQQGIVPAWQEIVVTLAGPLQNALMIIITVLFRTIGWWDEAWTAYFIQANMMVGLFNMLPVMPLDGGKLMQAALSLSISYYRSLQCASWTSIAISLFMIGYSLLLANGGGLQLNLLMIGLFLLYSNGYELRHIQFRFLRFLMNRPMKIEQLVRNGVIADPIVVSQSMSLQAMLQQLMREKHHLYYVVNAYGQPQAMISEARLIQNFFSTHLYRDRSFHVK